MKYEYKYVLFLDILGFKKIIEATYDKDTDNENEIKRLYDVLKTVKDIAGSKRPDKNVTQFSDSIVISFNDANNYEFLYLLDDISVILYSLAFQGIICRGAVAYGKFYHDEQFLFGPALVEAYETESKAAMYPRVIIDKSVIQIFNEKKRKYSKLKSFKKTFINNYLMEDLDDKMFIDYFYNPITFADSYEIYLSYLNSLRETISNGLSKARTPDVKIKYGWMKLKFNLALDKVKTYTKSDPKINSFLPALEQIKYIK